jgi:hypothetical protein
MSTSVGTTASAAIVDTIATSAQLRNRASSTDHANKLMLTD